MNKIYTITTMTKLEQDKLGLPDYGSTRTLGWFNNFDEAEKTIVNNYSDLWENCYDYAVIEEVEEGLYPVAIPRWFYHFKIETQEYERIEEPEWMHKFFNIGIG